MEGNALFHHVLGQVRHGTGADNANPDLLCHTFSPL